MIFNDIDWFSLIHWSFRKIFRQVFRFQKIKCYEVLGSSLLPSSLPSTSYRGVRSSRSWSGLPSGSRFRMRIKNNCSRFLFKLTSELFIPKIFTRFRIRFRSQILSCQGVITWHIKMSKIWPRILRTIFVLVMFSGLYNQVWSSVWIMSSMVILNKPEWTGLKPRRTKFLIIFIWIRSGRYE